MSSAIYEFGDEACQFFVVALIEDELPLCHLVGKDTQARLLILRQDIVEENVGLVCTGVAGLNELQGNLLKVLPLSLFTPSTSWIFLR